MTRTRIAALLDPAVAARAHLFDASHESAFRLFNGFAEGLPDLAIDLYAATLVVHDYAEDAAEGRDNVADAIAWLRTRLPWLRTGVVKTRHAEHAEERRGSLAFGDAPDTSVLEHGVRYAVDLRMNRDASLYLDTRELRAWAVANLKDRSVLNTFAYTGSLGVAARAGGAREVIHVDLNARFLEVAKASYRLNNLPVVDGDFVTGDFFQKISWLKHQGRRFDCVMIDPPFFAATRKGTVDLEQDSVRLINKVRPLINDGGHLVAVNNALFVSGASYVSALEGLCADGYLTIEQLVAVPADFTGFPDTGTGVPITDPAPFNHSTKIAILRVRRKDA